jgi:small subunit ribosomal protein S6
MSAKHYELMIIFTPVLSADELKSSTQNLVSFIKANGGEIIADDIIGLKTLSYPIQKKTTGLYYLVEYATTGSINQKLETQMNRDETILRHMITVLDKHAIAYNDRRRKGIKVEPITKSTKVSPENTAL